MPGALSQAWPLTWSVAELAVVVVVSGWAVVHAAESLIALTGLTAGFVGAVGLGAINALPET